MGVSMTNPTHGQLLAFAQRLAMMPSTDETMSSTWGPPDWDDLCDWWRDFVGEARSLTGVSYEEPEERDEVDDELYGNDEEED